MVRQILGAVSQFEKAMVVQKLRGARDRKSAALGRRVEGAARLGRISTAHVQAALRLRAEDPDLTLWGISAQLADGGYLSAAGTPYGALECEADALAGTDRVTLSNLRPVLGPRY
jgi:hypothetical protein